ncbi:ADP-ribosylglycohydrolase family protein [Sporomusa sp.]|jgi:ADP-ribosylglycohydrolase|uniref:ADP-ribosylglycohydrolase family protein n=1 Tax=Sporomusa sp. TaxID=2078658 RepID=UPI002BD1FF70|nr:ADP-ribosylglycohydrolase family protein [Sporomusa sp.]MDF2874110.1 draG [Sporomusa sp.]HWR07731.1 ADP-ribosylglycohydrolase family protein [Sporomusa sp.]
MLDRAYGCLIGAAIGDAMGMPASFMTPQQIEKSYGRIIGFNKPSVEQVAHGMLTEGAITDDTEESLIIAGVLIEHAGFSRELFVAKMKEWAIKNKMLASTVIGPSTRRFLTAITEGGDYIEAAKIGDTNGGAMRVAPIGIYYHGDIKQAVQAACESALVSHGSKPGVGSTCAVAAAVACAMAGGKNITAVMDAAIYGARFGEEQGHDIPAPSVEERIKLVVEMVDRHAGKSLAELGNILYRLIGAGMKSYESIPLSLGIFYAGKGQFEDCLTSIINIGDDADTNGAIVGALCGAFGGAAAIKSEWKRHIQEVNNIDLEKLAAQLIHRE